MGDNRQPMTPAEFDAACRELLRRCPFLSETSGHRSQKRNAEVGGSEHSKHLLGMAQDFGLDDPDDPDQMQAANLEAIGLGMWTEPRPHGTGPHLHTQGLPPGPVAEWWMAKYGPEAQEDDR